MLTIHFDTDIPHFLKVVSPTLSEDPTIHSLILSLADRTHALGKNAALLVRGHSPDGKLLIAGLQTDAFRPMVLSKASKAIAAKFAAELSQQTASLPGATGPLPTIDAFASEWADSKQCKTKLITNLRLFALETVSPPRKPSGDWRVAVPSDEDLIMQWNLEFIAEAVPHDPVPSLEELRQRLRDGISRNFYYLWEDHERVSLVGSTRETDAGRWIAPVYTPKNFRGHGYASALVAAVSQQFVNLGKKCILFTDLANSTSNSIYQKVGYRPLADFKHIEFVRS